MSDHSHHDDMDDMCSGNCCMHSRRSFLKSGSAVAALTLASGKAWSQSKLKAERPAWALDGWDPNQDFVQWGKPLRIQPILMYKVATPRKQRSWRSWGGVLTDQSANEEVQRIDNELQALSKQTEFPIECLKPIKAKTVEDAQRAHKADADIFIVYPASGSGTVLQACVSEDKNTLIFLRHKSGPVYYWYESLSVAYLETDREEFRQGDPPRLKNMHVDDVVVDDMDELKWRLRALYGVHNLVGSKMMAVGGVWGKYAGDAPQIARNKFKMDLVEVTYEQLEPRITSALNDVKRMDRARKWTKRYLSLPQTTLDTDESFVVNGFMLYELFKELMIENGTPAMTIKSCMDVIIPMSKTTACLTLGLLNDEGLIAFCESDFVVMPAGVLMRHITGTPIFMHNSTFPHKGIVTCAHCSAPRRMNGDRYEPTIVMTHEESDYGSAPKVEIPVGQQLTFIDPEYTRGRWLGFRGTVEDNPFYDVCRSQQDVKIEGKWQKLIHEVRDSHWMMCYGDYLKEFGFAARKLGLEWDNVTEA